MSSRNNKTYYILALAVAVGLLFHGASFFSTLEDTYDVFVHIFFADHYRRSWFDPWEPKWYTGLSLISYPPLLHQIVALLSFLGGLKLAAYLLAFCITVLYVCGAYRFAKLITFNDEAAGYAALIAVFLPSVVEAFHVFGQLPMMLGISWLLNALPEAYKFVRYGKFRYFLNSMSIIAAAVCSHHVTPIFGMVFFVVPLMATAVMDSARAEAGSYKAVKLKLFIQHAIKCLPRIVFFGFATIVVAAVVILPYWIWSKSDPIAQVPIPHGSRDNFIDVFSSGLVFFIIPWGFLLLMMPFYFMRFFSKRNIFLGMSFTLLTILGTGGTTPVAKLLLGENAFNILTLERFTFWATIYAMPLAGEFLWRFTKGDLYRMIMTHRTHFVHSLYVTVFVICIFFSAGFTMNLSYFRPLQPKTINLKPIQNFLQSDKHYKWRFLTLGFGDQMAWLSTNTDALTIDGNYHSARRVPELTTRAIERLENSKYRGVEGIGTLQQFLYSPEKFHLKYIFSNDKFYDPILYFAGWHRIKLLDNGIMVWERSDVSSLPSVLPKKDIPKFQKIMWGIIPLSTLLAAFFFNIQLHWINHVLGRRNPNHSYSNPEVEGHIIEPVFYHVTKYWVVMVLALSLLLVGSIYFLNVKQLGPEKVIVSYYDALDFKRFDEAHAMLDADEDLTLDHFLLEISVTDGLVDSYGKINSITSEVLERRSDYARIKAEIVWVTPVKSHQKTVVHEVVKKGFKWYLKPSTNFNYIPSDQFADVPGNSFLNQGRRTVTTKETFHEDVLDRPVVIVKECNLVAKNGYYHLVGMIQNIDNFPADITIKGHLLDSTKQIVTSYDEEFTVVHKLLPKETTGFRVDFQAVSWKALVDKGVNVKHFTDPPPIPVASFNLEVLASVTTTDLYKSVNLQRVKVEGANLRGVLFNSGTQTSTITQLLHSYYSKDKELVWVQSDLTDKSAFPKKSTDFSIPIAPYEQVKLLRPAFPSVITVNGLVNDEITQKYQSLSPISLGGFIPLNDPLQGSIRLNVNNYIGSATRF